jgi:hypothetical protein
MKRMGEEIIMIAKLKVSLTVAFSARLIDFA